MKIKSSPRLEDFNYKGGYVYSITICTFKNEKYFLKESTVALVLNFLKDISAKHECTIFVYCFMPDHLHLLLQGNNKTSLTFFIKELKQLSGFYFKKKTNRKLWHLSFYDHILRKEDGLERIALYILNNPVRKGLVKDFKEYPYLGSFIYDIKNFIF